MKFYEIFYGKIEKWKCNPIKSLHFFSKYLSRFKWKIVLAVPEREARLTFEKELKCKIQFDELFEFYAMYQLM